MSGKKSNLEYGVKHLGDKEEIGLIRIRGPNFFVLPCSDEKKVFSRDKSKVYLMVEEGYREITGPEDVINEIFDEYEAKLKEEESK